MTKMFTFLCMLFAACVILPQHGHGQAPVLGTAANFTLFTITGAVGNTGISHVTGDVGTNTGAITGFGNVNGNLHTSDGATLAASADVLLAYSQINSATPDFFIAPLLGNNDTLEAGVYSVAGAATLGQALYLDAQGDSGALFIFQLQGTLSAASNSQVVLLNGAQACNVFWKTEGLISLSANTIMKGTLLANNGAIDISSGSSLEGRALSTAGAVNISGTLAYTPSGCGAIPGAGPAAPVRGATACFGIFTSDGENTNAGVSFVVGDVGSNLGLTSGYDALNVTGMIHPVPDVQTAICAADLLTMYNYLNNLPADIELMFPAQFGNSLVLTPNTYQLSGATALTDTIFMNAMGNPEAVFVIKINGALSTSTFANVVLLNDAQYSNVFWKVDGAVSISDFSNFKGTIVANNGAVSMSTGVNLEGSAFTTTGAVNMAAVNTTMDPCAIPLPVQWLYFNGTLETSHAKLQWATIKEENNDFFTLEKSTDGANFTTLATIKADAGAGMEHHYSFNDLAPGKINFYRLSQNDVDGQRSIFKTIQLNSSVAVEFKQYTDASSVILRASGLQAGPAEIRICDLMGRVLDSKNVTLKTELNEIRLNKPSVPGIYFLFLVQGDQRLYAEKFLVQ